MSRLDNFPISLTFDMLLIFLAEAIAAERQSLIRLAELVQRCREVFGLWRILGDHQVHVVLSFLPKDLLETLKTATLRTLVVGGKEVRKFSSLSTP